MKIPTPQEDTDRAVAALTKWAGIACEERGYDGEEERLASRIRDELAALHAWKARAVPLLAALAYGGHEGAYIETQARALLSESEAHEGNDDDLSPLPCGCHRLPALACAAVKAHANPFAPWEGPVCDCPCHSGGVVVEARKEQGA